MFPQIRIIRELVYIFSRMLSSMRNLKKDKRRSFGGTCDENCIKCGKIYA